RVSSTIDGEERPPPGAALALTAVEGREDPTVPRGHAARMAELPGAHVVPVVRLGAGGASARLIARRALVDGRLGRRIPCSPEVPAEGGPDAGRPSPMR